MFELLEVLLLFVLRLGIPLLLTYLFCKYLRSLDEKWRKEGQEHLEKSRQSRTGLPAVRCWEIRRCSPEYRSGCPAYLSAAPCWECFTSNGHPHAKCSGCEVFKQALTPAGI